MGNLTDTGEAGEINDQEFNYKKKTFTFVFSDLKFAYEGLALAKWFRFIFLESENEKKMIEIYNVI